MFRIVNKRELNSMVTLLEIEAPFVAKKAQADEFHHGDGPDGDHSVIAIACLNQGLQLIGNEALFALRAIICHEVIIGSNGVHFVLQNDELMNRNSIYKAREAELTETHICRMDKLANELIK